MTAPSRLAVIGVGVGIALWALWLWAIGVGIPVDVSAYYRADLDDLYGQARLGGVDAYLYSPAFAQLTEPLRLLGWDVFREAWRVLEVGALVALAGPLAGPLLFLAPVSGEVNAGNIHLLLALAIVAGFRWPAAWAFVLLTKVTPGVGLVWFAVRREWRNLALALGATAGIVAVSFALNPSAWFDWVAVLARGSAGFADVQVVNGPLVLRVAAGAVLVAWGGRTDRPWTVLVAAWLALPVTWLTSLSMLAGLVWLIRRPSVDDKAPALAPGPLTVSSTVA